MLGMHRRTASEHWPFGFIQKPRGVHHVSACHIIGNTAQSSTSHQWDRLALLPFGLCIRRVVVFFSISSSWNGRKCEDQHHELIPHIHYWPFLLHHFFPTRISRKNSFIFTLFQLIFFLFEVFALPSLFQTAQHTHTDKMRPLQMLLLLLVPLLMVTGSVSGWILSRFPNVFFETPFLAHV